MKRNWQQLSLLAVAAAAIGLPVQTTVAQESEDELIEEVIDNVFCLDDFRAHHCQATRTHDRYLVDCLVDVRIGRLLCLRTGQQQNGG